ncbi:MAG: type II secretion system protein GspI [Proteobacteria bacterium]|nr:MAG: type II secretion system protein GspI [Pseudomonadota bacterium]MBC6943951.1 type II secretion system protein GspI [Gammaproteobacteria bacterium]MCL4776109.1 type II secretion system minor pseudopilin GspI [Gammaproteobacteria bacterium]MCQ3933717.1 type II secretion system protein GspI [Gammaproteobacteria bacterium]MDL1880269.1 type II secretion system protein GspI [Gammaproteobacteria bacterium PRO2]
MNHERPQRLHGFTLIEVMVALAIVAFGLIAVFGQLNQSATAVTRLRDRSFAHWVAMNRIVELRLAGGFPAVGTRSDDVEMANQRWHYQVKISATEDDRLRRVDVTVSPADRQGRPLATAVGFLTETPQPTAPPGAASGWPLLSIDGQSEAPPVAAPPPTGSNEAKPQ